MPNLTRQQPGTTGTEPMRTERTRARNSAPYGKGLIAVAAALGLAACGGAAGSQAGSTAAGGTPTISIVEPANNANVTEPFTLKVSSSEPLGATSTGKDHFHLTFDGNAQDYTVETTPQVTINSLSPGKHIIKVTLQHADHSPVGPAAQVSVTVMGAGGTAPATSTGGGGYGNGY